MTSLHRSSRSLLPVLVAALCVPAFADATAARASVRTVGASALGAHPVPLHLGRLSQTRLAPGTAGSRLGATTRLRARRPALSTAVMTTSPNGVVTTSGTSSTWNVTYTGFSTDAQVAFQRAVDIWAATVTSSVAIDVKADLQDLMNPGLLGQAGAADFAPESASGHLVDPIALANAKAGSDQSPGVEDIDATFNSNTPYFCYGTAIDTGSNCVVDFTTVVLHELGHGLGFAGSFDVDGNGRGQFGFQNQAGTYLLAPDGQRYVPGFDTFAVQSNASTAGKPMLSFAPGTTGLAAALTGGDGEQTGQGTFAPNSGSVYWDGPLAKAAYQGRRPRLYTPRTWEPGSSYSHVSDSDFPASGGDSLMSPYVGAEVIRTPGNVVLGVFGDLGYGVAALPGSRLTPIAPVRLLDTRTDPTPSRRALGPGGTRELSVRTSATGAAAVPAGAKAVVLNVTGVSATASTYLQAYPAPVSGTGRPTASNVNLRVHETRANLVTVALPPSGLVRLRNEAGATAVVVDLAGYYSGDGSAKGFHGLPVPVRLADTRATTARTVAAGGRLDVDVSIAPGGAPSGVPATASAVVVNLTAVGASTPTFLTAYPTPASGTAFPLVSNVNVAGPAPTPNLAVVAVGAGHQISIRNGAGTVAVLVDVAGYYDAAIDGQLFHPVAPERLLDTRYGLGAPRARLGTGASIPLTVSGRAGISGTATSVVLNLTGVAPTTGTYLSVTPGRQVPPATSNVNLVKGQTAANLATVGLTVGTSGREQAWVYNAAAAVDVLADVAGWFGPA